MATPATTGVPPSAVEGTRKPSRSPGGPNIPAPSTTGPSNHEPSTARSFIPRQSTAGPCSPGSSNFGPKIPRPYSSRPSFTPRHSTAEPYTSAPLTLGPYNPRPSTARSFTPQHSTAERSNDECSIVAPPFPGCPSGPGLYNPSPSTARPVASGTHVDGALVAARPMNRGKQPQRVQQQRKPLISKKGQQNRKTAANDNAPLSRPKKQGAHQTRAPRSVSSSIVHKGVREKPPNISAKSSSSSANSPSSAKAKRTAIDMEASSIGERDIVDLVNDIKSQNTNNGGGRLAKGGPWMAKEDEVLRLLVEDKGEGKWSVKAKKLNAMMREEYDALEAKARAKGETPETFGRVAAQCLHRWKKVLKPGLNKGHWTTSEDEIVRTMVQAAQTQGQAVKWNDVAELLDGRMGKQCRERWLNHLDPAVKKTSWTPSEDEVLFHAQAYFGSRWCQICRFIPGRTENASKNRFNSAARKRWIDSTGTILGGETSKLFIQELLRAVNEKKEKELQISEGGAPMSSSAITPSSLNDAPSTASCRTALSLKKCKQFRPLITKISTDTTTAASKSVVYSGLVRRGAPVGVVGLRAVQGWQAPAGTGKFSAGVRSTVVDGTAVRAVEKRRIVQPERYTDGGWAKHSDAEILDGHRDEFIRRDHHRPARGQRPGLLREFKERQKNASGAHAARAGAATSLVESSVSGRRGDACKTGAIVVRGRSNSSDRAAAAAAATVTPGGRSMRGKIRPSPNGRSVNDTNSSLSQQPQRPPLLISSIPRNYEYAASSASSTPPPLQPPSDNGYGCYDPSASMSNDRTGDGAAAAIAPSLSQQATNQTALSLEDMNLINIHDNFNNKYSGCGGNASSGNEVRSSVGDFLLDTCNRTSQFDSVFSSPEGWGNALKGAGAGVGNWNYTINAEGGAGELGPLSFHDRPAYDVLNESGNQVDLPVDSVAGMVESSAMLMDPVIDCKLSQYQDNLGRVPAAPNLPPLLDLPPLQGLLPPFSLPPSPPLNPRPSPNLPLSSPSYYIGGTSQPVAPSNNEILPQHQALASANNTVSTPQGSDQVVGLDSYRHGVPPGPGLRIDDEIGLEADNSKGIGACGDYGASVNYDASIMDVDHGNAAAVGGDGIGGRSSGGGNDNLFVDMLVDGTEGQPAFLSFAAAARDPVAGDPPLVNVEEVCRSVDQQEGRAVFDDPMSELPIPLQRDSPIGGIPAPTISFWN